MPSKGLNPSTKKSGGAGGPLVLQSPNGSLTKIPNRTNSHSESIQKTKYILALAGVPSVAFSRKIHKVLFLHRLYFWKKFGKEKNKFSKAFLQIAGRIISRFTYNFINRFSVLIFDHLILFIKLLVNWNLFGFISIKLQ